MSRRLHWLLAGVAVVPTMAAAQSVPGVAPGSSAQADAAATGQEAAPASAPQSSTEISTAQPAPSTNVSETTETAGRGLEDIVVTAQKRESKLERTPMTINVISGNQLVQNNVLELKDIKASVPGLTLNESPGGLTGVSIRGVGTSANNQLVEQSVGLFVDGVYHPRARQFRDALFDVERVEVIKGSQGVLFGKNTSVGAISIVTRTPGDKDGGYLQGQYELNYGSYSGQGAVDLILGDTFKVRIGGIYEDTEGWVRNRTLYRNEPQGDRYLLRAVAVWDPTPALDVTLKLQTSRSKTVGNNFEFVTQQNVPGLIAAGVLDGGLVPYQKYEADPGSPDTVDYQRSYDPSLVARYDLGGGYSVTSTTGYSYFKFQYGFDSDSTPGPFLLSQFNERYRQFSQEVRLSSPTGKPIEFIVGGLFLYSRDNYNYLSYYNGFPVAGGLYGTVSQQLEQVQHDFAGFGQGTWHIADNLRLDVGGRVNSDTKSAVYTKGVVDNLGRPTNLVSIAVPGSTYQQRNNDTTVDFSGTLSFNPTPGSTLYVSGGRGNKGAAFNNQAALALLHPNPFLIPKEVATTYEAGIKGRFLDGRAYFSLAGYHLDIANYQDSFYNPTARAFQVRSIDASTTGLESEGQFQVVRALNLYANLAYNPHARLANGEQMQRAPHFTYTIGARANKDVSRDIVLSGNVQLTHSSSFLHQPASALGDNSSLPYDLLSARIQMTIKPTGFSLYVQGSNLTKELYRTFVFGSPLGLGQVGAYNEPRMITLGVRKDF